MLGGALLALLSAMGMALAPALDRLVVPQVVVKAQEAMQREVSKGETYRGGSCM